MRVVRHLGLSGLLIVGGAVAFMAAAAGSPSRARQAIDQTWPPFVLVAGLLAVGLVAHRDGLFGALGGLAGRVRAHPGLLLVALLLVVAAVTSVLNLDTSVAFLTPMLVLAARQRGVDEEPFLYGTLLMSNAASLLLPGSNLTNLLVLAHEHVAGAVFAARMLPAWVAAIIVTAVFVLVVYRRQFGRTAPQASGEPVVFRFGRGTGGVVCAAVLVLVLRSPAVPVAALGAALVVVALGRGAVSGAELRAAVDPAALVGVFGVAVALGTLARMWGGPAHLMAHANSPETAVFAAVGAVAVNNLPAAMLLGSRAATHPRPLLLGLNLGPNLGVTGSLSALIWYRAARTVGARPSPARLSLLGVVLVPISLVASAAALHLLAPARL